MNIPCEDCVFFKLWGDDEIKADGVCTHPLVYKTIAMCPIVMNFFIKARFEKVGE